MLTHAREKKTARDWRTRQDRILRQVEDFQLQMDAMVDAYMQWSARQGQKAFPRWEMPFASSEPESQSEAHIRVIDLFGMSPLLVSLRPYSPPVIFVDTAICTVPVASGDKFVSCALLQLGLVPCTPVRPTVAISIRTLEFFRVSSLYAPHFTLHAFGKVLCYSHIVFTATSPPLHELILFQAAFKPYLAHQLSVAFDVYLALRRNVDLRVKRALQHNEHNWHLKNCCPACTYELKYEKRLTFRLLFTMDGNDSLKRVRGRRSMREETGDNLPAMEVCNERPDDCSCGEAYFLSRETVYTLGACAEDIHSMDDEVSGYSAL